jgi:hypothetical protein
VGMSQQLNDRMYLLIALKRLGTEIVITADDLDWLKGQNIEIVFNGGRLEGTTFRLFKETKWPPCDKFSS